MATSTTSRIEQDSLAQPTLYLAFELGKNTWKLGFTIGMAQQPRERMIPSGDVERLQQEIARAKQRFGLPEEVRVVSCYEAGRDGFWLHRESREKLGITDNLRYNGLHHSSATQTRRVPVCVSNFNSSCAAMRVRKRPSPM
jgi:hypothetical protein